MKKYYAIAKNGETVLQTISSFAEPNEIKDFKKDFSRWALFYPDDKISIIELKHRAQASSVSPINGAVTPAHGWEKA